MLTLLDLVNLLFSSSCLYSLSRRSGSFYRKSFNLVSLWNGFVNSLKGLFRRSYPLNHRQNGLFGEIWSLFGQMTHSMNWKCWSEITSSEKYTASAKDTFQEVACLVKLSIRRTDLFGEMTHSKNELLGEMACYVKLIIPRNRISVGRNFFLVFVENSVKRLFYEISKPFSKKLTPQSASRNNNRYLSSVITIITAVAVIYYNLPFASMIERSSER